MCLICNKLYKIWAFPVKSYSMLPMREYTTLQVGGPADIMLMPETPAHIKAVLNFVQKTGAPLFVLGAGANILVADNGIRGIVLNLRKFTGCSVSDNRLSTGTGLLITEASEKAEAAGLSGLEFIYSMPGTVGGAAWMNARCYGSSVSDVIDFAEIMDSNGEILRIGLQKKDFGYKVSPFQSKPWVILNLGFILRQGNRREIRKRMDLHKSDRERKGHFLAPSAGSVFKKQPKQRRVHWENN